MIRGLALTLTLAMAVVMGPLTAGCPRTRITPPPRRAGPRHSPTKALAALAAIRTEVKKAESSTRLEDVLTPHFKKVPQECRGSVHTWVAVPKKLGRVPSAMLVPGLLIVVEPKQMEDRDRGDGGDGSDGSDEGDEGDGSDEGDGGDGAPPATPTQYEACAVTLQRGPSGEYALRLDGVAFAGLLGGQVDGAWSEPAPGHALLTMTYMRQDGSSPTCGEPDFRHDYEDLLLYRRGEFHFLRTVKTGYRVIRDPIEDNRITSRCTWHRVGSPARHILAIATRTWYVKGVDKGPDGSYEKVHWTENYTLLEIRLNSDVTLQKVPPKELVPLVRLPALQRFAKPRSGVAKAGASTSNSPSPP